MKDDVKGIIELLGITPGPWEIKESMFEVNHGFKNRNEIMIEHSSYWVEGAYCGGSANEGSKANDKLIAAAPGMLEALIKEAKQQEHVFGTDAIGGHLIKAIEKACYPKSWEEIRGLLNVENKECKLCHGKVNYCKDCEGKTDNGDMCDCCDIWNPGYGKRIAKANKDGDYICIACGDHNV